MKIKYIILLILMIGTVNASTWVNDFNDCPTNIIGDCLVEGELVCGIDGTTQYCTNPSNIVAPVGTASSNTDYSGSFNGGYIIDCEDYNTPAPFCNNDGNFWCDRNSTCYTTQKRDTTCIANVFGATTCGNCRSDYLNCDTDDIDCEIDPGATCDNYAVYTECFDSAGSGILGNCTCSGASRYDCDNDDTDNDNKSANYIPRGNGNGCEVLIGTTACTGGLNNNRADCTTCECNSGYIDCDAGGINLTNGCEVEDTGSCTIAGLTGVYDGCTCKVSDVDYGTSGIMYNWSGSYPFLWFNQYGTGPVFNFSDNNNVSFYMNASGLFWNGTDIGLPSVDTNTWNTTLEMINAANSTNLLINWSFVDTTIPDTNESIAVSLIKTNISAMLADIVGLKGNMTLVTTDISGIKTNISTLETKVNNVNTSANIMFQANSTKLLINWSYVDTNESEKVGPIWTNLTFYDYAYNNIIANQSVWETQTVDTNLSNGGTVSGLLNVTTGGIQATFINVSNFQMLVIDGDFIIREV